MQCPEDINFGSWLSLDQFHDPELKQLSRLLPAVLLRDKAPGTIRTYINSYRAWKRWASHHRICPILADCTALALYIVALIQKDLSVSCINSAIYGIDWVHLKNGHAKPSEDSVIKQVVEAAKRMLAKLKSRKTPLAASTVRNIVQRLEGGPLGSLQLAALICLGFYGFLRWDDLSRTTPEDLMFAPTHLTIYLSKRKNDQFHEGSQVLISRSDEAPCPVGVVQKFLELAKHDPRTILWRHIQHTKSGQKLRKEPMSYSRANQLLKKELEKEGLDPKCYGLHSLRSGGATTAASMGIPDRLLQRQGGWRSNRSVAGWNAYVVLVRQLDMLINQPPIVFLLG